MEINIKQRRYVMGDVRSHALKNSNFADPMPLEWRHISAMASEIIKKFSLSNTYSGQHQTKHQSSALLSLCEINPPGPLSLHKGPCGKRFHVKTSSCLYLAHFCIIIHRLRHYLYYSTRHVNKAQERATLRLMDRPVLGIYVNNSNDIKGIVRW